jgi:hypothetical protein
MFAVDPVPREIIDSWPVEEAGLPTRVINSVRTANVSTIGQLRQWSEQDLLQLRSLGKVSLDQITYFFKLCTRVEKANQRFNTIQEVFDIFLDVHQAKVLVSRYGFHESELKASRNWVTLQEIGNQENKTRERIRQVEEIGKEKLKSRMATVCLQPFYAFFEEFIDQRSMAISTQELAGLRHHDVVRDLNPASILLTLSDLNASRIRFRNDFFSTLSLSSIESVENHFLQRLSESASPLVLDNISGSLRSLSELSDPQMVRRAIGIIADHHPLIGAAVDERYFLYTTSVDPLVEEIMEHSELPVHYRTVTSRFNDHVKGGSRKGAGFILEVLNRIDRCRRVDRGIYTLTS